MKTYVIHSHIELSIYLQPQAAFRSQRPQARRPPGHVLCSRAPGASRKGQWSEQARLGRVCAPQVCHGSRGVLWRDRQKDRQTDTEVVMGSPILGLTPAGSAWLPQSPYLVTLGNCFYSAFRNATISSPRKPRLPLCWSLTRPHQGPHLGTGGHRGGWPGTRPQPAARGEHLVLGLPTLRDQLTALGAPLGTGDALARVSETRRLSPGPVAALTALSPQTPLPASGTGLLVTR